MAFLNSVKTLRKLEALLLLLSIILVSTSLGLPVPVRRKIGEANADHAVKAGLEGAPGGLEKEAQRKENVMEEPKKAINLDGLKFKKEQDLSKLLDEHMIKKIPIEDLKPVDHLDGVKMEQDGHVNKEYHKELFLGDIHEEFQHEPFDEAKDKLVEIVHKADVDKDEKLSKEEMEKWILTNMEKHFKHAKEENDHIFKHLDPDGDGNVTWLEYHAHFLVSRGLDKTKVLQYVKDYDSGQGGTDLMIDDKEQLMSYKMKWMDADKEPEDNQLTRDEFMVFRHPEHCKRTLQTMVENVMKEFDTNHDNMLSAEEFSALPPGEVEGDEAKEMDRKWQENRKKEFGEIMDINKDGFVTSQELMRYLDPTNPVQAKVEANSLMDMIDTDHDNFLSLTEIEDHAEIFMASKLGNFAANVHDEF